MANPEILINHENLAKELLSTHMAIRYLIGKGRASDYFDQPTNWLTNNRLYLILNPNPLAPEQIKLDELDSLIISLGPDSFRLRCINPRLLESGSTPLPLGGSCAIETWGMKMINYQKGKQPDQIAETAEFLLEFAPTITHITGAISAVGNMGVHFIEDGLWGDRIEDEYRVPDGRKKTTEAYKRIHEAVERRAKLASGNPNYSLYPVNFSELELSNGPLQRWFEEMGLEYNPNFGIAQVIYTYVGPELLELVKNALITNHGVPPDMLQKFNIAARIKQIDHNDWDATMAELKSVILGNQPNERQRELLKRYPFQAGLAIGKWIPQSSQNNSSAPSGFFDLSYGGKIVHMEGIFPTTSSTLIELEKDPRILRNGNLSEHLAYLSGYTEIHQRRHNLEGGQPNTELKNKLQSLESKIKGLKKPAEFLSTILSILEDKNNINSQFGEETLNYVFDRIRSMLKSFIKRQGLDTIDRSNIGLLSETDRKDLASWLEFLSLVSSKLPQFNDKINAFITQLNLGNFSESSDIDFLKEKLTEEYSTILYQISTKEKSADELRTLLETQYSQKQVEQIPSPRIIPVNQNLIVMYATQFTFDPDFREYLKRVAQADKDKENREQEIARLSTLIFPKLEAYLRYIFEGGEYPAELRFTRIFE